MILSSSSHPPACPVTVASAALTVSKGKPHVLLHFSCTALHCCRSGSRAAASMRQVLPSPHVRRSYPAHMCRLLLGKLQELGRGSGV